MITTAPQSRRIAALDVARGIAILGTFGTNVWIFADPQGMVGYFESVGTQSLPIRILQTLAQGKFLGLLSLMFGVGLAITQASAHRHGRPWPGRYWRRAALLFVDGLVHYLLIAEFDVLMGYALVSLVVSALLILSPRTRGRWIAVSASVHVLLVTVLIVGWSAVGSSANGGAREGENIYADGSFVDLIGFRIDNALAFRAETVLMIPLTIAMFLGGARLYQRGLFAADGAALRRRAIVIGAIAAVLDLSVAVIAEPLGFGGPAVLLGRYLIAPLVALGLLAVIAGFYLRREPGMIGRAVSSIGTTALSCYVLQNLIASILCYGWGFGLAARYGGEHRLAFTVAVYVAVAACLLAASAAWTRRFDRGPIEMAMHALR